MATVYVRILYIAAKMIVQYVGVLATVRNVFQENMVLYALMIAPVTVPNARPMIHALNVYQGITDRNVQTNVEKSAQNV